MTIAHLKRLDDCQLLRPPRISDPDRQRSRLSYFSFHPLTGIMVAIHESLKIIEIQTGREPH
jgi:hypothetical protein